MARKQYYFSEWLVDWRGYLGLLLLSISGASLRLLVESPQKYPDFIAGRIAWHSLNKSIDNHLLALFFIIFTVSLLLFNALLLSLKRQFPQTDSGNDLHYLLLLASCPAIWLSGNSIFIKPPIPTTLFSASALLVLLVLLTATFLLWREKKKGESKIPLLDIISASLLFLLGACFAALALLTTLARGFLLPGVGNLALVIQTLGAALGMALVALAAVWLRPGGATHLRHRLLGLLLGVQLFLPGLYFLLLPSPWLLAGTLRHGYTPTKWLWLLIALLILLTYGDLGRRLGRWRRKEGTLAFADSFSPLALLTVVLLFKLPLMSVANIPADDYHFGENLLPGFLWLKHNLAGFIEFDPARGLFQSLYGILTQIFFDGSAAALNQIWGLISALFALALMLALVPLVRPLLALFILLLCPFFGAQQFVAISIGALILLHPTLIANRVAWLSVWWMSAILSALFSPQYGPALGLGSTPLAIYLGLREYRQNRRRLLVSGAALLAGTTLLCGLTPLGTLCWGMLRYTLENLTVNATANGIPWLNGWNNSEHQLGPILWEFARASWLGVLLWIITLFLRTSATPPTPKKEYQLMVLAVWGGLLLLLIPYGFGRIDPGAYTRIGIISLHCVAIVLPLLLFLTTPPPKRSRVILIAVSVVSIVSGGLLPNLTSWEELLLRPVQTIVPDQKILINGKAIGLPTLGQGYMDQFHFQRLAKLKSSLDLLLSPGETYLDLSNRQAQYFYLDKPVPIQSGASYNLPGTAMQLRALRQLATHPVPAVLIGADNLLIDGGPASLRSPLLYREFILHYVPIVLHDLVFLVAPERLPALQAQLARQQPPLVFAPLEILNNIFVRNNLELLPVAWGQSFPTLASKLTNHISLEEAPQQLQNLRQEQEGWLVPTGDEPAITFDTTPLAITGPGSGLLALDFECQPPKEGPVRLDLSWKPSQQAAIDGTTHLSLQAQNGKLLIPVDSSPKWLLAEKIEQLRLTLPESGACTKFRFRNLTLAQRVGAVAADALWQEGKQATPPARAKKESVD